MMIDRHRLPGAAGGLSQAPVTVTVTGAARPLPPDVDQAAYRIVQEALTNVSRHAQASKAVISVHERDGLILASVQDDGKGMPGAERLGPRGDGLEGGFGMGGMRERAELVRGELEFAPAPDRGTIVRLSVPLAGRPGVGASGAAAHPSSLP